MALPLDRTGIAASNRIANEVHNVNTLEQQYIIPLYGTFHVRRLRVYNDATGALLEPVLQYNTLHQNTEAANEVLQEVAQVIHISDPTVRSVRLEYQAVGGEYENISATVSPLIRLFIDGVSSSLITNTVANEYVQTPPRSLLSVLHNQDDGSALYTQLSTIAEAVAGGDPSGMQMVYEFIANSTRDAQLTISNNIAALRTQLNTLYESTKIADGQYLFTHEDLNPFVYLNYGTWVNNPNLLFYGSNATNPDFGGLVNVSNQTGVLAMHTMAYRRDDDATPITYTLASNKSSVDEGSSVVFTLTAPGLVNGTRIGYTISGIESTDIVGGALTGDFVLNASAVGTVTIAIVADNVTDGQKTMTMRLTRSPEVFKSVIVNDTSQAVAYSSYFSSDEAGLVTVTTIDEGSTGYLQVRTQNIADGVNLNLLYDGSTTLPTDFEDPLPTQITITGGKASVRYRAVADFVTEGGESLIVSVCTGVTVATMVTRSTLVVLDTSRTPTISTYFTASPVGSTAVTEINEGWVVYLRIFTGNLPTGSTLSLTYSGTASNADFSAPRPTSVQVGSDGTASVIYTTVADQLTEGDETFAVTVGAVVRPSVTSTSTVTIKDTSVGKTITTFVMASDAAGNNPITTTTIPSFVYLCVKTVGFTDGERLTLDYSRSDPAVLTLLGTQTTTANLITITGGVGYVGLNLSDTNGVYLSVNSLRVDVRIQGTTNNLKSLSSVINPRAIPTATMTAINSNGGTITSVNEGSSFRVRINTANMPNGAPPIPVTYGGTATAADFTTVLPTSVVITNNLAYLDFTVKADQILEGSETFIVNISLPYGGGSTSVQITLVDTSVPTVNMKYTSDQAGNVEVSTTNEGTTVWLHIAASGYPDGAQFTMTYAGTIIAADLTATRPTSVTISGGKGVVSYSFVNDFQAEGNETMVTNLTYNGTQIGTKTITVNDTSLPGPTQAFWSRSANPDAPVGSLVFSEGETAHLHIRTQNVPVGAELITTWAGTASGGDFGVALPSVIPCSGNVTSFALPILEDLEEEPGANEWISATVRYGTISTTSGNIVINDTSQYMLAVNGEIKEVTLKPGERYLLIVQGGGGSAGRSLAKQGIAVGEGNGNRGSFSAATFVQNGTEVLDIFGFGGGYGRGTDNVGTVSESDVESGGYVLVSPRNGGNQNSFIVSETEMIRIPGMDSGQSAFVFNYQTGSRDASSRAGINSRRGLTLPNPTVTNALWSNYGSGGENLSTMTTNGHMPKGGGAGGTFVGLITNTTSNNVILRLIAGYGGVTDNSNNNGGIGTSGGPGQPGCVFVTKVASNYSLRTATNNNLNTLIPSTFQSTTYLGYNGNTFPGNKLSIPTGKRLVATFVTYCPSQSNLPEDDYTQGMSFHVLKAEGNVYSFNQFMNSGPVVGLTVNWYWKTVGFIGLAGGVDTNNVLGRFGKIAQIRCGWSGYSKNVNRVPYKQGIGVPQEYLNRLLDYPENDFMRTKGGGFPAQGSLNHGFENFFTVNNNVGQGWFYPTADKYINGTHRMYISMENPTNQLMEVAPVLYYGDTSRPMLEGWLVYRFEDI